MVDEAQRQWSRAMGVVRAQVGEEIFQRWFEPLQCAGKDKEGWCVSAPDPFFRNWFAEHYGTLLQTVLGEPARFDTLIPQPPLAPSSQPAAPLEGPVRQPLGLNSRYTFESFVVGPSNRFAHAACLAAAESPGKAYNPLFIYGGVGLGKTHLMQAIGDALVRRLGHASVCYLSSEQFTNQLIEAIQHRTMTRFRERYRTVDVLLIDDIHFIAGKEATHEEFFHTFNTLHDARKQIVVSSDRSPKEIPGLEERLISRFEWGLVTDIQPPDLETRVAILRKKAQEAGTAVDDHVTLFIAERIQTNIRELEGALIRVVAYAKFSGRPISLPLARSVLGDMLVEEGRRITLEAIELQVASFFRVSVEAMKSGSRQRSVLYPRQVAMYLARTLTDHSLPEIGRWFGGRDHTTALHAINRLRLGLESNTTKRAHVEQLTQLLQQDPAV